jgi:hypothetical protein
MRTLFRSDTSNSSCPALPGLIRAPISVLGVVTMPSNGATMLLKGSIAPNRSALAFAESIAAFVAAALPFLSSAACCDTHCDFTRVFRRWAVADASCALAAAVARSALAWANCWPRSGVSPDASSSPALT